LHEAPWKDRVDLARLLVKSGTSSKDGSTPSYSSVPLKSMARARRPRTRMGGSRCIGRCGREELISHAFSANMVQTRQQDKRGWTPLHLAMWRGRDGLVRLLIGYSADTTAAIYKDGSTPRCQQDLACLLVEYGVRTGMVQPCCVRRCGRVTVSCDSVLRILWSIQRTLEMTQSNFTAISGQ